MHLQRKLYALYLSGSEYWSGDSIAFGEIIEAPRSAFWNSLLFIH